MSEMNLGVSVSAPQVVLQGKSEKDGAKFAQRPTLYAAVPSTTDFLCILFVLLVLRRILTGTITL